MTLIGADRAIQRLKMMDANINSVLPEAAKAGAEIVVKEAQRRVPKRTGRLARNIKHKAEERRFGYASRLVYVNPKGDGFYGKFIEYGTRRKKPKRAKAMKIGDDFAKSAAGVAKRPFFRPAIDSTKSEVNDAIARIIKQGANL